MKKIIQNILKLYHFLFKDIWQFSNKRTSPLRAFFIKQIKIFIITIKGFMDNKVVLRASSLTYFSLMSVVPIVAMAFGIAKGFGMDKLLEQELSNKLEGQQEVLNWIIQFANSMLQRTQGGVVAGVGLILLFYSVMSILGNIEASFNFIWEVKKGRTLFRKFADYLAIMIIAPVIIILSSSVTVYITTQIEYILESIKFLGFFSPLIRVFINLIPYVLIWFLFSFIYIVMPNTNVRFGPAILAGMVAGTIFQITQWGYVKFQIGVSSYNAIYGSFAALPLFMLWVQIGWLIVLFGAELSYAAQNFEKYEYELEANQISAGYKKSLSLLVMNFIVKRFSRGEPAPTIDEISGTLEMPSRIVREIINHLHEAGLISKVVGDVYKEYGYQPSVDIGQLTIKNVFDKLDSTGVNNLAIASVPEMQSINQLIQGFSLAEDVSASNILVKDIN